MKTLKNILSNNLNKKIIIMPVGISGSGKTTLYHQLKKTFDIQYISFDQIRIDTYRKITGKKELKKEDYREVYRKIDDKKYKILQKAKKQLQNTDKNIIYIDNTNLKKNSRKKFLNLAEKYLKISVFFIPDLKVCVNRQFLQNRDKTVPVNVILQQYQMLEEPDFSEFDIIVKKRIIDGKGCCHHRGI